MPDYSYFATLNDADSRLAIKIVEAALKTAQDEYFMAAYLFMRNEIGINAFEAIYQFYRSLKTDWRALYMETFDELQEARATAWQRLS